MMQQYFSVVFSLWCNEGGHGVALLIQFDLEEALWKVHRSVVGVLAKLFHYLFVDEINSV